VKINLTAKASEQFFGFMDYHQ